MILDGIVLTPGEVYTLDARNDTIKYTLPVPKFPPIKKVIFHSPATIVYWFDNTKTVVKAQNEVFDPEKGLAMAIAKKALGNKGNYFDVIKKHVEAYREAALNSIHPVPERPINKQEENPPGFQGWDTFWRDERP